MMRSWDYGVGDLVISQSRQVLNIKSGFDRFLYLSDKETGSVRRLYWLIGGVIRVTPEEWTS